MSIDISDIENMGYKPVTLDDTMMYHCTRCGECCRNVKGAIFVESLDLFRLARLLKMSLEDVALQYTDTALLAWGFPILVLKTKQHRDTCVFLKASKCSVHDANPRACRTYPLGLGPDDEGPGRLLYFIVSKKQHHFTGSRVRVGDLIDSGITYEDRAFIFASYTAAGELAKIMRRVDKRHEDGIMKLILYFSYFAYDTEEDFQRQYVRNMAVLKDRLLGLAERG